MKLEKEEKGEARRPSLEWLTASQEGGTAGSTVQGSEEARQGSG